MNRIMRMFCWTMAVVFPVSLFAGGADPAMLKGRGVVKVNGSPVPVSYTVYGGDQITTGANASVHLLAKGTSITLPEDSSILYGGRQLEVQSGRVLLNTTAASGVKARIGGLTIVPAGRNARFQMANSGEKLVLAALDGALRVTDGVHSIVLSSGKMMTSAAPQTAGGGPGTGTGTAASSGGIPGWVVGVLVIGVAGGVIGGLAAVGEFGSASPSIP
jgi:hypothetical protein